MFRLSQKRHRSPVEAAGSLETPDARGWCLLVMQKALRACLPPVPASDLNAATDPRLHESVYPFHRDVLIS